ncbi:allene oxide synthase, DELAYED DEHISCENCE 2, CYTOCHROME P450 74A [Hibiscus trionum]|uniref:Allene oxide synthase, DELAYED DEHISCENCE 2, CYTOCHROME P450 74A n=1 Tax=Hibiscus trionum TaxID=183268 RepID=A0A9W7HMD8_HIBTR|nr:allene oxide synthase, DELAYED DEHISCENCE 2, CYTOCHROME P450 74A [Hibiscus trionum]
MASVSSPFTSLHLQFNSPSTTVTTLPLRQPILRPIRASLSENPTAPVSASKPGETKLPLKEIPGDYGLPFVGPIKDRLDYFYNQGRDEFFRSKIQKYQSTVFRTNMPPGPFISSDPKVVALLDGKSFPVLFDVSKVEKKDLFTGTYMPSTDLTGGYRVLSYLDPSEPKHAKLKQLVFFLLKSSANKVIPEFEACYSKLYQTLEKEVSEKGKSSFQTVNDQAGFNFLCRAFFGSNPPDTKLGDDGPGLISKWVLLQLGPVLSLGLPGYIEELAIRTFPLPPFLVKKDYQRLYDFFYQSSGFVQDEAEKLGISREEACHNMLFATCFNTFGGMKLFFPNMLKWIGRAGIKLHTELAKEIRSVIKSNGGKLTMAAMEQMPLTKSVVYEGLRIEPPVPSQYGRAKKDLLIESHDAVYRVKEGEMLYGYQPFATKDPKIFEDGEEFVPDRFMGDDGERLLKHVLWSNGPETENPTLANKQCAGKDFVVVASRLFVVELFRQYDSFEIEVGKSPLGAAVTVTSLKRASF